MSSSWFQILKGVVILSHTSQSSSSSSLTLIAPAFVNDGNWHSLSLITTPTWAELSIDSGRVSVSANITVSIQSAEILVGGAISPVGVVRGLDGCLQELVINDIPYPMMTSSSSPTTYDLSEVGVAQGCSGGDLCSSAHCPIDSICTNVWQDVTCSCGVEERPLNNQCQNPCILSDYCNFLGTAACIISGNSELLVIIIHVN